MTWPSAPFRAVKMTIALCIAPKPEGVALIGRWSANDRVYHRDAAKASSGTAPVSELHTKSRRWCWGETRVSS